MIYIKKIILLLILLNIQLFSSFSYSQNHHIKTKDFFSDLNFKERNVIVNKGTERPFSGIYNDFFEQGLYVCKACNNPLFTSEYKFVSNCGWPSFDNEIPKSIIRIADNSYNMIRIEIVCANCKGHLGHVFEGEKLTKRNTRHCVNSISIKFISHD